MKTKTPTGVGLYSGPPPNLSNQKELSLAFFKVSKLRAHSPALQPSGTQ